MLPNKMHNVCIDLQRHAEQPPRISERESSSINTSAHTCKKKTSKAQEFADKKREISILLTTIIPLQKVRRVLIIIANAISGISLFVAFPSLAILPITYNTIGLFILWGVIEVALDCTIMINTFSDWKVEPIKSINRWKCHNTVTACCLIIMMGILIGAGVVKCVMNSKGSGILYALNSRSLLFVVCSCGVKCPLLLGVVVLSSLAVDRQQRLNILEALTLSKQQIDEL